MKAPRSESIPDMNARLMRYLSRLLPEDQARDVVQDAWESLHLCLEKGTVSIPADRGPLPWLYRTVRNRAIDLLRRQNREAPVDRLEQIPSPTSPDLFEIRTVMEESAAAYSDDFDGRLILRCLLDRSLPREDLAASLRISERTLRREIGKLLSFLSQELRRRGYSPTDLL